MEKERRERERIRYKEKEKEREKERERKRERGGEKEKNKMKESWKTCIKNISFINYPLSMSLNIRSLHATFTMSHIPFYIDYLQI